MHRPLLLALLLTTALVLPAAAQHPDCRDADAVSQSSTGNRCIVWRTVHQTYTYVEAWQIFAPQDGRLSAWRRDNVALCTTAQCRQIQARATYEMQLWQYDCSNRSSGGKQWATYGSGGRMLDSGSNSYVEMEGVIPESVGETLLNAVCAAVQ